MLEMEVLCPKCRKNDKVYKVAGIISADTHRLSGRMPYSDVYTDSSGKVQSYVNYSSFEGTQTSALARSLAPPRAPAPPSDWGVLLRDLFIAFSIIWILSLGITSFFGLMLLVSGNSEVSQVFLCLSILALPNSIFAIIYIYVVWRSRKVHRRAQAARIVQYEAALARWKIARENWEGLYYCRRHDLVFLPDDVAGAPREEMYAYLYRGLP